MRYPSLYAAGALANAFELLDASGALALLVVGLFVLVAWQLGDVVLSRLMRRVVTRDLERFLLSTALGLGIVAYATFAAASLHLLSRWGFRSAFVIALGFAALRLSWLRRANALERPTPGPRGSWLIWPVGLTLGFIVVVCLLGGLSPETEFDALNHHLGTVRLYLREGGFVRTPSMAWSSHPFTVQMLFAASWLVYSQLATKLMHFALGMLAAAGCFLFCRRHVSTGSGVLAALLFLGCPMVTYLSATAYVDLGLALFATLSVYAFYNWLVCGLRPWAVLAGTFAGLALGSKYFGGTVVVASAVTFCIFAWRARKEAATRRRLADFALYLVIAAAVFAPWLVKNYALVGNPISPFLAEVIPTLDYSAQHAREFSQYSASWKGYAGSLVDFLKTPWFLTFRPDLFDGSIGPAYFFLFPFALVLGWRRRAIRFVSICVVAGYLLQIVATRNVRYYVVLFPWLSIAIAGAVWPAVKDGRLGAVARRALVVVAVALVVLQLPWFSGLWPGPAVLTLNPDHLRLFRTQSERDAFFEPRCLGNQGREFYQYLEGLPPKSGVLALTPVYQSQTDQTIFMAPNSSVATDLSFQAIHLAQREQGLDNVRLEPETREMRRFWRVDIHAEPPSLPPDEVQPRLFIVERGVTIEIGGFGVRREESGDAIRVLIDLHKPRKLDLITFVSKRRERPTEYRLWEADSADRWREAETRLSIERPPGVTAEQFLSACSEYGVSYVVLGHHPGALFLLDYFLRESDNRMRRVRTIGGYQVIELTTDH